MVYIWPLFVFMVMVNGVEVTNTTTAATVTSMAATEGMVTTIGPAMTTKGNSTDNGKQYVPILDEGLLSLLTTRAPVTEAPPPREHRKKKKKPRVDDDEDEVTQDTTEDGPQTTETVARSGAGSDSQSGPAGSSKSGGGGNSQSSRGKNSKDGYQGDQGNTIGREGYDRGAAVVGYKGDTFNTNHRMPNRPFMGFNPRNYGRK